MTKTHFYTQKTYECNICMKSFTLENDLTKHEISVHDGQHFKCEICDKTFTKKYILTKHCKSEHESSATSKREKQFSC